MFPHQNTSRNFNYPKQHYILLNKIFILVLIKLNQQNKLFEKTCIKISFSVNDDFGISWIYEGFKVKIQFENQQFYLMLFIYCTLFQHLEIL